MTRRSFSPWLALLLAGAFFIAPLGQGLAAQPRHSYPSDADRYALAITAPRSFEATLDFELRSAAFEADDWDVFAAQPPTLATQTGVSVRLVPGGKPYREPASPGRALVRSRIDAAEAHRHGVRVRLEYRATLSGRELMLREPGRTYATPERLSAAEREQFLETNQLCDFQSPDFERLVAEHALARRSDEGEIAYARRVFLALKHRLHYEYHWTMDRRATQVARTWSTDCAGMSVLFTSLMRAHAVPARVLAGRWARSSQSGAIVGDVQYYQQHVKAEFYAERVGWVPVDLSSAVEHDHSSAGLQYFGRDQGNFLTIHIDPLVQVDTRHFGRQTFTWLQGVHYYASGKGTLRDKVIDEQWRVNWLGGVQSSLIGGSSSRL